VQSEPAFSSNFDSAAWCSSRGIVRVDQRVLSISKLGHLQRSPRKPQARAQDMVHTVARTRQVDQARARLWWLSTRDNGVAARDGVDAGIGETGAVLRGVSEVGGLLMVCPDVCV
jgi:hypothetical protein